MKDRTQFKKMTMVERLWYMLTHEHEMNRNLRCAERSPYLTDALWSAVDILPEGKNRRALDYMARHSSAEFHFGGTDAVGPAMKEAIMLMIKAEAA